MKKFLMVMFFSSPAQLSRYVAQHKHLKQKDIISITYNTASGYQLWYYTKLKWEEKYNMKKEVQNERND